MPPEERLPQMYPTLRSAGQDSRNVIRCYFLHAEEGFIIEDCRLKIEDLWNFAYFILKACCLPGKRDSSRRIDHGPDDIPDYKMIRGRRDQLLKEDHKKGHFSKAPFWKKHRSD